MLRIDYANCMNERIGDAGLDPADLERARPQLAKLIEALNSAPPAWRRLPFKTARDEHVAAVQTLADQYRPTTDQLVVLGIGGSALGNSALHQALTASTWNLLPNDQRGGPRLFVLDNVDPDLVGPVLQEIRRSDPTLQRTLINVISKSGETAETAAQFLIVRDMLEQTLGSAYRERIVAVTDPAHGTMRSICDREGYTTLPVPDGVGGRFSVLSPVGLFSAAMCGINIAELLDGAAAMDERCSDLDPASNPAAMLAWVLISHTARQRSNHVLMSYSNRLHGLADWYRQLWAESLGKRVDLQGNEVFAGATPIKALGATDQHSQLQLYREGPDDKVIGLLEVESFAEDVPIPTGFDVEPLQYLQGASLGQLLNAEKHATEYALLESARPNYTIRFPRIDAGAVGEFIQLWQITTALAAGLLNINAYDQPAVETGKKATFGLMGRPGYEQWQEKIAARLGKSAFEV